MTDILAIELALLALAALLLGFVLGRVGRRSQPCRPRRHCRSRRLPVLLLIASPSNG